MEGSRKEKKKEGKQFKMLTENMLDPMRSSGDPHEMYINIAYGKKEETWVQLVKGCPNSNASWLCMYERKVVHLVPWHWRCLGAEGKAL